MTSIERKKLSATYRCLDKRVFPLIIDVSIRLFYSSLKQPLLKLENTIQYFCSKLLYFGTKNVKWFLFPPLILRIHQFKIVIILFV